MDGVQIARSGATLTVTTAIPAAAGKGGNACYLTGWSVTPVVTSCRNGYVPVAGPALSSSRERASGRRVSPLRIWLVGFGMVGKWVAGALDPQAGRLTSRYGRAVRVVGIANARDGFVYHADGLDLASVLAAADHRAARRALLAERD